MLVSMVLCSRPEHYSCISIGGSYKMMIKSYLGYVFKKSQFSIFKI
jgi:hypothetical protein